MGIFGDNKQNRLAEESEAKQRLLAAQGIEAVDAQRAATRSTEQARMKVFGLFGAPGTYDLPDSGDGVTAPGPGGDLQSIYAAPTGPSALALSQLNTGVGYKGQTTTSLNKRYLGEDYESKLGTREDIIDPDAYASEISKTSGFRIRSRLTAEAEQMLAHKGDAWNQINQATMGVIAEGAAASRAEETREIRNLAAKGGTARRNAFAMAQSAQVRERSNTLKIQQSWVAGKQLDSYIRANAEKQAASNEAFLNGLPLLRENYGTAMSKLSELMAGVALPSAITATAQGTSLRFQAKKEPNFLGNLVLGGAQALIGSMFSGGEDTWETGKNFVKNTFSSLASNTRSPAGPDNLLSTSNNISFGAGLNKRDYGRYDYGRKYI